MNPRLPDAETLPDLLIDRCKFGLTGLFKPYLKPVSPALLAEAFASFAPVAQLTTPASHRGAANYFQVTFYMHDEQDHPVGHARLDVHCFAEDGSLRLGNRTSLELNPQKV